MPLLGYTRMFLLQLLGATLVQATNSETPLVSFENPEEILFDHYNFSRIFAIEEDFLHPGGFLIGDNQAVVQVSPELNNVTVIAGKAVSVGFQNAIGQEATLGEVHDIFQFSNGTVLLIADHRHHCIRKIDRLTANVSTFAGACRNGNFVEVKAKDAIIFRPVKILQAEDDTFYYVLRGGLAKHNLVTDFITSVLTGLPNVYSAIMDSTKRYIYLCHGNGMGISRLDTATNTRVTIAGSEHPLETIDAETIDGSFENAGFQTVTSMTWLIQDQVLLVTEFQAGLRVVNFVDRVVTSLCKDRFNYDPNDPKCNIHKPFGVKANDDYVYTGNNRAPFRELDNRFVRVSYSQPLCDPNSNNVCEQDTPINITKEVYTHLESVGCSCRVENSTVLPGNSTCVRAAYENGTVYGTWETKAPVCEMDSMLSSTSSSDEMTTITERGTTDPDPNNTANRAVMLPSLFLVALFSLMKI